MQYSQFFLTHFLNEFDLNERGNTCAIIQVADSLYSSKNKQLLYVTFTFYTLPCLKVIRHERFVHVPSGNIRT